MCPQCWLEIQDKITKLSQSYSSNTSSDIPFLQPFPHSPLTAGLSDCKTSPQFIIQFKSLLHPPPTTITKQERIFHFNTEK